MEKCRDITVGYTTEQKCDKWPQQVCTLDKVISKNTTPDTKVSSFQPIANMRIWYKTEKRSIFTMSKKLSKNLSNENKHTLCLMFCLEDNIFITEIL